MSAIDTPAPLVADQKFVRGLGLLDSTMLVAGSMIGSGIFIVSADISRQVGSPGWLLVVWMITGLPPASTRVAPMTHCAVTHGGVEVVESAQPATVYGVASVTTNWPPTCTRGESTVGFDGTR